MRATQVFEVPGGRIAFDDTGGDGTVVIAAPGMGDTRNVYRHLRSALAGTATRLVTMDIRGMGESSVGWRDLSDGAIATDYLALIDHLGVGRAVLMGNSMSAAAAVIAATTAPEKVAGIMLIGPFVRDVPLKWWQKLAFAGLLARPWGRRAWLWWYENNLYGSAPPADLGEHVEKLSENLGEPGRFAGFRSMASNSHDESGERLSELTQPVTVVMGTADPDFPDAIAEAELLGQMLAGEVVLVDGAGHYPQAEDPRKVAAAVMKLVNRIESNG